MKGSKIAAGMVVAVFLATLLGVALASNYHVSGYVYFTEPYGDPVPCVDVYLYSDPSCSPMYLLAQTETNPSGYFQFYGPWPDSVWLKLVFDADKSSCEACSLNIYGGTCGDTTLYSDEVTSETETLHFNIDQSDCSCPSP